jgi:5-methylcytosine-specific restriction enzyme subunit McrC
MFEFDGVSNRYVPPSEIEALLLDRRFNRFRNLIQQASLILQGFVPGRSGQEDAMSLLFDMNRVFESCIGNIASRVVRNYGGMATLQMSGRSLLYLGEARRSEFLLKPDIGIHTDCIRSVPPLAIIDTKWKTLTAHKGVSSADMYQMYAYGVRYNCPKVILLYPHIDDMSDLTATYHHEKHEDGCTIHVETIDLSDRMTGDSAGSVEWQLKQLFERLGISNQIAAKNRIA